MIGYGFTTDKSLPIGRWFLPKGYCVSYGVTRCVLLTSRYAIKFVRMRNMLHFLQGCYANWSERHLCRQFKTMKGHPLCDMVAPSLWCSYFGLVQIQVRVEVCTTMLSNAELIRLERVRNGETKHTNFGYYQGRIVCLDYA